ncbi:MAG: hypothetical protein IPM57_06395 [Oligoflexia bacterium]|nr:hypothetical protein [Oligoflexia bacterium]
MKKTKKEAQNIQNTQAEEENNIKSQREHAFRKDVVEIYVLNIKNLNTNEVLFSRAEVLDVSATGMLLAVKRDEIVALSLRSTLTMSLLHDIDVGFTIEVMDTYIEGAIKRTKPRGRGEFLIAVDFREDAPEYWRESLVDLLPTKDEDDEEE